MTTTSFSRPFDGQVCLVTGAAGAIGSGVAEAFGRQGASLFLTDRVEAAQASDLVRSLGTQTAWATLDITKADDVQSVVEQAVQRFGRIDVLVNVAGVVSYGSAEGLEEAEWDRVLDINLKGTFLMCQAVMPVMRHQGYGRIVNLGSVVAFIGGNPRPWIDPEEQKRASNVAYGVSKAGVHAMTTYLAKELAAHGVTVNAVAPGPVASGMTTELPTSLRALIPVGRMGTREEIAGAIVFLAAPTSGFVTGAILDVNGGIKVG